ncbi:ATP-binding protein [Zhihengliuella halotolerans]|uniref:ATP-binding protein n=1 Tax=Zhihengliuella halotolerans TaxID=370736 RepID=UPI0015E0C3D1|nr:sensor histidine kinase [Zhihengliuella halotolerans]
MAEERRRGVPLARYLFRWNLILLAGAVGAVSVIWAVTDYRESRSQYEQQVLTMAESVAVLPAVQDRLAGEDPEQELAALAETLREASGMRYIVFVDADGIRRSHPDPDAIGQPPRMDAGPVLDGQTWTGVERGPAGLTLRARVPVQSAGTDDVVGYVSAGILASEVRIASVESIPLILGAAALVVGLGGAGAHLLSRRLKAKTHGLEPEEIAALLDGREALLYSIGEGVVGLDRESRIVLANDSARDLLDLPALHLGRTVAELGLEPRAREILGGTDAADGELLAHGGRILVCDRRPVHAGGGVVVTVRDQTEVARLTDQLDGAHTVTNGLRAQRHEFANRIHTAAGLLELGAVEEAKDYLTELSAATTRTAAEIAARIGDLAVSALVLAKSVQAAEQGTDFEVSALSSLPEGLPPAVRDDVLLVVGNLVDNAVDAAGPGGWVELFVLWHDVDGGAGMIEVRVTDSGPGIAPELGETVFAAGTSTKDAPGTDRRGLGLALVRQMCVRRGGTVEVDDDGATTFSVLLPVASGDQDAPSGPAREGRQP